jgi:hypothetical protein
MKQIIVTFTLDIEDDTRPQEAIDKAETMLSNAFYAATFVESTEIKDDTFDWVEVANTAHMALDRRKLSGDEKLALTIRELHTAMQKHPNQRMRMFRVHELTARSPLSQAEMSSVFSRRMDEINALLGTGFEYERAHYSPSGAGAFGRQGGGRRGKYHRASVVDYRFDTGE